MLGSSIHGLPYPRKTQISIPMNKTYLTVRRVSYQESTSNVRHGQHGQLISPTLVKSFHYMGTKFHGLTIMGMLLDTWIRGFKNIHKITKVNTCFVGILNSWIALPTKNTKYNVQWIKLIWAYVVYVWSHYLHILDILVPTTAGQTVDRVIAVTSRPSIVH